MKAVRCRGLGTVPSVVKKDLSKGNPPGYYLAGQKDRVASEVWQQQVQRLSGVPGELGIWVL
jgi:hypothetical protein